MHYCSYAFANIYPSSTIVPSGERVCGQEDTDAFQYQWPWEPNWTDLPAPLWKHCVVSLVVTHPAHHRAKILNNGPEMMVLKWVLSSCLSLPGTVMGIFSLDSPTDTLWLFPLTPGRLVGNSTRLTTIKIVSTAWLSHQHWTRLPRVGTTGTHRLSKGASTFYTVYFVTLKNYSRVFLVAA